MDYKITFDYKKTGKGFGAERQRALQAQKRVQAGKRPEKDVRSMNVERDLLSTMKNLNSSIKSLEKTIKTSGGGLGRGGAGRGGGILGGAAAGAGAGIGRIGNAIPLLGAGIAALGFTVSKINQIGNAFIETASRQAGSVGLGGFRRGQGMYTSEQVGGGMKAYAMGTGRFSGKEKVNKTALNVGGIFGLSAGEALGTAGLVKRAGGNYKNIVTSAAGRGMQSDIPVMLQGISATLEEAIKNGINTSDMAKDIGKEVSVLANEAPGKSAAAAINILRSFSGTQKQVGQGRFGTYEGLLTARASQQMLMQKLTGDEGYRKKLLESGTISKRQYESIGKMGKGATFDELTKQIGGAGSLALLRKQTREASSGELLRNMIKKQQEKFGTGAEGRQRFVSQYLQQGGTLEEQQLEIAWNAAAKGEQIPEKAIQKKGAQIIGKRAKGVEGSYAGMAVKKLNARTNLLLKYGDSFAQTSLKMEKAMLGIAEKAAPGVEKALLKLGDTINEISNIRNDPQKRKAMAEAINKSVNPIMNLFN